MGKKSSTNRSQTFGGCSASWDQKKVADRESRLIPRKVKETIHSLKNPNHIKKISYILPEIWFPKIR